MEKRGLKSKNIYLAYSTIGIQLAATLLLCLYGGYKLDSYFDTSPWFIIAGTFFGMFAGFFNLIMSLKHIEKKKNNEDTDDVSESAKWL